MAQCGTAQAQHRYSPCHHPTSCGSVGVLGWALGALELSPRWGWAGRGQARSHPHAAGPARSQARWVKTSPVLAAPAELLQRLLTQPSQELCVGWGHETGCDKLYAKSSHLKAHCRQHRMEQPYPCAWPSCGWWFSRSDELSRHKRSHSSVRPDGCAACEKFAHSDHLAKHVKIPQGQLGSQRTLRGGSKN